MAILKIDTLLTALLYTSLPWSLTLPILTQELNYAIIMNGRTIGHLQTAFWVSNGEAYYTAQARVLASVLGQKRITTLLTGTYRGKQLTKASVWDAINEKTRHRSEVNWDGSHYQVRIDKEASYLSESVITYSTAMLHYHEPVNLNRLFSERHGRFCSLRRVGHHTYELLLPDGKKNYYTYVDGICQEVKVQDHCLTFYFKRQIK